VLIFTRVTSDPLSQTKTTKIVDAQLLSNTICSEPENTALPVQSNGLHSSKSSKEWRGRP